MYLDHARNLTPAHVTAAPAASALAALPKPLALRFFAEDGASRRAEIGRRTVR